MDYLLAKQLKDAGFPQKEFSFNQPFTGNGWPGDVRPADYPYNPTLEELIEACGDELRYLENDERKSATWKAYPRHYKADNPKDYHLGSTPTEAVAKLWLALNKAPNK